MAHGSTPTGGTLTVRGPASSTDSKLAVFDGTTGKYIKEADITSAAILAAIAKMGNLTIASPRDLDALAAAIALNTAKVTNANHTGDVTGDEELTLAPSGVTAGTYLNPASVIVDAKGRVTSITGPRPKTEVQGWFAVNQELTTHANVIPIDNTPPLIGEGDQLFSLPITASSLSNLLKIEIELNVSNAAILACVTSLFVGSDTCTRAWPEGITVAATYRTLTYTALNIPITTLSEQLIRVRFGPAAAGTFRLNSLAAGGSMFGAAAGMLVSSLRVTEYTP
jgi:hypothetical protein